MTLNFQLTIEVVYLNINVSEIPAAIFSTRQYSNRVLTNEEQHSK